MAAAAKKFRFAGLQVLVGSDKEASLARARDLISQAVANGARLISLPECFNCPYSNDSFPTYAEPVPGGPSTAMLQEAARKHSVYLVGGSIPERDGDRLYNTSVVATSSPSTERHTTTTATVINIEAMAHSVHLFDICVPPGEGRPGITFNAQRLSLITKEDVVHPLVTLKNPIDSRESDTLSPGDGITSFKTEWCDVGLGICYDIRFPEMAQVLAKRGVKLLLYPGAFNTTTGPAHWELLQRSRAVDNQMYVATVSPARNPESKYQAWGHSTVVDPWGTVIATTEHDEAIIYADIDLDKVDEIRQMLPVSKQKRNDLYQVTEVQ